MRATETENTRTLVQENSIPGHCVCVYNDNAPPCTHQDPFAVVHTALLSDLNSSFALNRAVHCTEAVLLTTEKHQKHHGEECLKTRIRAPLDTALCQKTRKT